MHRIELRILKQIAINVSEKPVQIKTLNFLMRFRCIAHPFVGIIFLSGMIIFASEINQLTLETFYSAMERVVELTYFLKKDIEQINISNDL